MMQVNIQHVFDEQKANFDHFNEHHSQDFKYTPGQTTQGCVNSRGCLKSNKYGICDCRYEEMCNLNSLEGHNDALLLILCNILSKMCRNAVLNLSLQCCNLSE